MHVGGGRLPQPRLRYRPTTTNLTLPFSPTYAKESTFPRLKIQWHPFGHSAFGFRVDEEVLVCESLWKLEVLGFLVADDGRVGEELGFDVIGNGDQQGMKTSCSSR